jgi:predicted tellurium resistance membrane protein TerC
LSPVQDDPIARAEVAVLEELLTFPSLVALLTLLVLEIVLGIDNVIFIAIVTEVLPKEQRPKAQRLGLGLALFGRVAMVLGISLLLRLEEPLFHAFGHDFSFADLVLIAGGLFLVYKAVREIFNMTELVEEQHATDRKRTSFAGVIGMIVVIDMIFAVDSVLTAVGLTSQIVIIIIAIAAAIGVMMFYAVPLSRFISDHPSVKLLALSFLLLIGIMLFMDGFGRHIERGYIYFAIIFALGVEALNFRRRSNLEKNSAEPEAKLAPEPAE